MSAHYKGTCPYCGVLAHFTIIDIPIQGTREYQTQKMDLKQLGDSKTWVNIVYCDNCHKDLVVFFKKKVEENDYNLVSTFPLVSSGKAPKDIPQNIWDDYAEGVTCIHANAPKGAVVMFRRATQSLAKELGATSKHLYSQLKELKDNNLITEQLHKIATELRLWGNFGAHPDDDLLKDVTIDEAREMKDIFWMLLDYTLIQMAKVSGIEANRKKKKK